MPSAHGLTRPCPFSVLGTISRRRLGSRISWCNNINNRTKALRGSRKSAGVLARAPFQSCFYQLFWLFQISRCLGEKWRCARRSGRRSGHHARPRRSAALPMNQHHLKFQMNQRLFVTASIMQFARYKCNFPNINVIFNLCIFFIINSICSIQARFASFVRYKHHL